MKPKVIVLPEAKAGAKTIAKYIAKKFGQRRADTFNASVKRAIIAITILPQGFEGITIVGIEYRKFVIDGLSVMLYSLKGSQIFVHKIVDARTNWQPTTPLNA